jgi:hypothetical protein
MKINMWHHKETNVDTQQISYSSGNGVNNLTVPVPVREPGPVVPRPLTPPNGYRQPPAPQLPVTPPQPFPAPQPQIPDTAKFQMRLTALRAAKDFLMERSYDDNASRLAAEVDLAKFYLGEN